MHSSKDFNIAWARVFAIWPTTFALLKCTAFAFTQRRWQTVGSCHVHTRVEYIIPFPQGWTCRGGQCKHGIKRFLRVYFLYTIKYSSTIKLWYKYYSCESNWQVGQRSLWVVLMLSLVLSKTHSHHKYQFHEGTRPVILSLLLLLIIVLVNFFICIVYAHKQICSHLFLVYAMISDLNTLTVLCEQIEQ